MLSYPDSSDVYPDDEITSDIRIARRWFDEDGAIVNFYESGACELSTSGPDPWAGSYGRDDQ